MADYDREFPDMQDEGARSRVLELGVRLLGVALALVGIAVALLVVREAWSLYAEPARIERFAEAVEAGSNLDKALMPPGDGQAEAEGGAPSAQHEGRLSLSYFLAWGIVGFLLALIARIALTAVKTGGDLALHDNDIRKLARALLREQRSTAREVRPSP